jgi:hypothetical protein
MNDTINIKLVREVLLWLVEKNEDKTWLSAFEALQNDQSLPEGGAGSLNDWGPYYKDSSEQIWYGILYDVFRMIERKEGKTNAFLKEYPFAGKNNFKVFECKLCGTKFYPPSATERYLAIVTYEEKLSDPSNTNTSFFVDKAETMDSDLTKDRRTVLLDQLTKIPAHAFDFVKAKAGCPKCPAGIADIYHNLYQIRENGILEFMKQDGDYFDFNT